MLKGKAKIIVIVVVVLGIIGMFMPDKAPPEHIEKAQVLKGINAELFEANASELIGKFNTVDDNLEMSCIVTVNGGSALAEVTLSDLAVWDNSSEVVRTEFVSILGDGMDEMAVKSAYNASDTVGVNTVVLSPNGNKLAERTLFGEVKLY